jgi:hypothetical protein
LGVPSSISRDATLLLRNVRPAPRVLNAENIPPDSPFVLTVNHYDHPGLGAWWGASVMLCAVAARRTREPREVRFAIAREWWYPSGFGRAFKQPLTRWFFGQVAKTYGLITLPPVLEEFRGQAAPEIRRALALTRGNHPQLVGLAPEGRTGPNLSLCEPPAGAGLFLQLLTHDTIPCLPAGIFEDTTFALTVNFGAPFQLRVQRGLPRDERDRQAARRVMVEIGKLLPERMWGVYREEIGAALRSTPRQYLNSA